MESQRSATGIAPVVEVRASLRAVELRRGRHRDGADFLVARFGRDVSELVLHGGVVKDQPPYGTTEWSPGALVTIK